MKYQVINTSKFHSDIKSQAVILKMKDGLTMSKRFEVNGLHTSTIGHSVEAANTRATEYQLEDYECDGKIGLIGLAKLRQICQVFRLDENDYILQKKEQEKPAVIVDRSEDMKIVIEAINKLGAVLTQSMEYQKECLEQLKILNDKYNKPSAYIRK